MRTDAAGNEYPEEWFSDDDLTETGYLTDSNGREYSPYQGALEPIEGRCNAPLSNWRDRYPQRRFCSQIVPYGSDSDFCSTHRGREDIMKSAEEHLQTGAMSKSIDHRFSNLGPYQQLLGYGLWESMMGESSYEFAPETQVRTLDFSDYDVQPDGVQDGVLEFEVAFPTDYGDRAISLYCAAMDTVSMLEIKAQTMMPRHEDAGVMETKTTAEAMPKPALDGPPTEFMTIEEYAEHHLNLPYSRLVKDRERLLEYGGVVTDVDADNTQQTLADNDIVLDVTADTNTDDASPNALDEEVSREIVDSAGSGDIDTLEGTQDLAEPQKRQGFDDNE